MAIAPATTVKLYEGIPWSRDKFDFRYFGSYANRNKYFNETLTPKAVFNDFTYLRNEEGHPISVPIGVNGYNAQNGDVIPKTYSGIMRCNYVFYENPNYAQHWFGGFITDIVYKNDGCAWIYFEEDIYHNWASNIIIDSGFIERETVDDDTIGKHTLLEPVQYPSYTTQYKAKLMDVGHNNLTPVIFSTELPEKDSLAGFFDGIDNLTDRISYLFDVCPIGIQGGLPQPYFMYVCKYPYEFWHASKIIVKIDGVDKYTSMPVSNLVQLFMNKLPSIITSICLPKDCLRYTPGTLTIRENVVEGFPITGISSANSTMWWGSDYDLPQLTTIAGIKKNKCYAFPYHKILAQFAGTTEEFARERFRSETGAFRLEFSLTLNPCLNLMFNYENVSADTRDTLYNINFDNFPTLSYSKDQFSQWYAYNKGTVAYSAISAALNVGMLAAGARAVGDIAGTTAKHANIEHLRYVKGGAETRKNIAQADYITDNAVGVASSIGGLAVNAINAYCAPDNPSGNAKMNLLNFTLGDQSPIIMVRRLIDEQLHAVDNYFSMFGYKVNRVGKPNLTSRKNWNYVKTQNAHCSGNAPQYAIEFMEKALDTGCTFWHKNAVGDYGDLSNPIV